MRKFTNRLIAFLFFLIPLISNAQTNISGKVVNDKDGTPVAGASVLVPVFAPFTNTDANGRGSPFSSVTRPVTRPAKAAMDIKKVRKKKSKHFLINWSCIGSLTAHSPRVYAPGLTKIAGKS